MNFFTIAKRIFSLLLVFLSFNSFGFISSPSLFIPSSNIILKRLDASLSIRSVTNATGYQIEYDTVSTFNSKYLKRDYAVGTYPSINTTTLFKGKKYYWRARAYAAGDTSSWTSPWNFTVYTQYDLQSPADGTSGPLRTLFGGSAGQNNNVIYLFELDTVNTFKSSNRIFRSQVDRAFIDSNYFKFGRKFFWRATAVSDVGDTLDWSVTRSYTIYTQPTLYNVGSLVDPQVVLSWSTMESSEVVLEIDTVSTFNSGMYLQKILEPRTLRDTLRNLPFGQRFYYRIRDKFNDQYSSWSTVYNFKVRSASSSFSPSNNSTIQNLVTSFSWSKLTGVMYHVQVASDTFFSSLLKDTILENSTFYLLDTLNLNTKYFWRIKYMHETDTTDWINLAFKTYTGQVNAVFPSNNATNQDVRITFRFVKLAWADSYVIEIDTGKSWNSTPSQYRINASNFYDNSIYKQIDTLVPYNASVIWRVYAIRGTDTAQASPDRFLTTKKQPNPKYPNNNYIGIGTQTNAQLDLIIGSSEVIWEMDTVSTFNSGHLQTGIAPHVADDFFKTVVSVEWPGDLRFETKYYWRAKFLSPIDTSEWSSTFNFTTTQRPWLTAPTNNATNVSTAPKLVWGVQGSAEDYVYQYQIGTTSDLSGAPIKSLTKGSSAEKVESCVYGTTYYWRARALHSKDTSMWSETWKFTTGVAPTIPRVTLGTPFNTAKNIAIPTVPLIWYAAKNADSYDIEVATNVEMTNLVAVANVFGTGVDFKGMKANEKYYWRVRGVGTGIIGPWSYTWSFETVKNSSVSQTEFSANTVVYPNPIIDVLNVKSQEMCSVAILNAQGQLVYRNSDYSFEQSIDMSALPNGVYWLQLSTESGLEVKKVVVQR